MVRGTRILITGANGFIGRALCERMLNEGWQVRGSIRSPERANLLPAGVEVSLIESIGPDTDWSRALNGIDAVVHLAARAHIMKGSAGDSSAEFRIVNISGTARLARMAAVAGVKRLVYVSSIKVNGELTLKNPFTEEDMLNPRDSYAISKLEAEQEIQKIASENGLEFVIIRSPLVYGSGVGANFLRLMRMIDSGIPMPFASIKNSRSLIYISNLVDAIIKCIEHPAAANKVFLVSDGEDLSTAELIRRLAKALGKPARLVPFPRTLLYLAGGITGKSAEIGRLTNSLVIDSARIRNELHWIPPFRVNEGLRFTADWYRSNEKDL